MRGPVAEERHPHQQQQQQQQQQQDESRLARVKRALLGGRAGGGHDRRLFGQPLELAERHNESGVPLLVHRLCGYIESHASRRPSLFRLGSASSRAVEKLRAALEKRPGVDVQAEIEAVGCPAAAALLLRQYLLELPSPVVPPGCVSKLVQLHSHEREKSRESWMEQSRELVLNELEHCNRRLFGYLVHFLARFETQHGCAAGVCGIFAPILLPYLPPATLVLRDLLLDAAHIFPEFVGVKEATQVNRVIPGSDCKPRNNGPSPARSDEFALCFDLNGSQIKTSKRKERRDSDPQERKLIRSNSEEKIWENSKRIEDNRVKNSADSMRRVSSHEDFNKTKHHHLLTNLQNMRHGSMPLNEVTNVSPVSSKTLLIQHSSDVVLSSEKFDCDAERLRNSERFSRAITPRGKRQVRRRKLFIDTRFDQNSSKENDMNEAEVLTNRTPDSALSNKPSFLEMFTGPSRSPSPVRLPYEQDDINRPTPTKWSFQIRQSNDEEMDERVVSPRNSLLIPRRFYSEDEMEDQENITSVKERGTKSLVKQINSLKKKIKKYEGEFEENFGYRPSHSDKMSNRDIKKIVTELNKVRKEHKMLKEGLIGTLLAAQRFSCDNGSAVANNNNNVEDKYRATSMSEMVTEIDKKLAEKRLKSNRPENLEELSYEQLLDEKIAVQKALLQMENTFGRPVSKEDRCIVRPLYDRYRTLKRSLIRAGANRYQDSMSELATILEHEAMDFTSGSGTPIDCDRRASEPEMSHRGMLDCIDSMDQVPTDSDSQHSSSEGSRGVVESLHSLSKDELLLQQRITKEEKKRLRRALKELEMQFEARAGRRMKRDDRGPQINVIYDSYKQTKAKLRLISALLAKNASTNN